MTNEEKTNVEFPEASSVYSGYSATFSSLNQTIDPLFGNVEFQSKLILLASRRCPFFTELERFVSVRIAG